MSEKLQKVLARAGLGSRREIETWIEDGRLMVNGAPALLGTRVEPKDEVKLDGRRLRLVPESLVNRKILMYHKPEGEVTTRKDPEGRPTVFDRLPPMRGSRWVAIGRLDLNTSGLLLFTNDGEVANRLMHPSHEVEREYAVRILGELKPAQRKKLLEGVLLEDGLAKFNSIESRGGGGSNRWYHVTLSEGRTREVRRMFESMDLAVSRLIRVRYGPVALDPLLKQGMNRELNLDESNRLCEAVGIEPQAPRAERRRDYQQSRRSETVAGYSEFAESDGAERSSASSRKPKVIGSKADELPTDRVERAAELLRRRRAAESAGVEFSGRNGRLSGKRTLRESELRKIAQDKAAEKAAEKTGEKPKRGERDASAEFAAAPTRSRAATGRSSTAERTTSGRTTTGRTAVGRTTTGRASSRAASADADAPRARSGARAATGTRSTTGTRSSRTSEAGASTGRSTASRSPTARASTSRSSASRTGPARASTRADRDDDDFAPRRSARPAPRSRDAEEEAPRRRSAAKPAARSTASRDERPARSRAAAGSAERAPRSSSRAKPAAAGRSAADRSTAGRSTTTRSTTGRSTGERATAARSSSSRTAGERSQSAGKPAARSAGSGKPARSSARPAAPARSGGASRGAGKSAAAKPAGKGKRTR